MNSAAFKEKYPNITIGPGIFTPKEPQIRTKANHNLRCLFETLPEHQRTILNQRGLQITWDIQAGIYENPHLSTQILHSVIHSDLPVPMGLPIQKFSAFDYTAGTPLNDYQRAAQLELIEECTHALDNWLVNTEEWKKSVRQDWEENNTFRNNLLESYRTYSSYASKDDPEARMVKSSLKMYWQSGEARTALQKQRFGDGIQIIRCELSAEIEHSRNFLNYAQTYGSKKLFCSDAQEVLDAWHKRMPSFHDRAPDAVINDLLTKAFPATYPVFTQYEQKLRLLAKDIKNDPSSYPGMNRPIGGYLRQILLHGTKNKWNERFNNSTVSCPPL